MNMKKNSLNILGLALTLVFALVLAGCGETPNDLAKKTYDLYQEAIASMDNPMKLSGVILKAVPLGKKVNNLSESDRQIFNEELVRLGGAELSGLFDIEDLSSLFDDGGGAGLGGLFDIEKLSSLFGGDAEDGGVSAQSGGAVTPSGNTTASSSGGATALPGSGKTAAFFSMFDSGTYHMKAKTTVGGMEVISETFIKGDMMAMAGETGGMSYRSIKRDNMMYVIDDGTRTVMVMPFSASLGSMTDEPVRTDGMVVTSSGTARFNGKNLPYEEYSIADESSVKVQFFIDGNNPAGIRTITGGETIDMVILALDQNVPNSAFEIPAGYQRMEIPQ